MSSHQILIASYPKDYAFLEQCLWSLREFSRGFLPPVVSVASEDELSAREIVRAAGSDAEVRVRDGRQGAGFMRAQLSMMEGDKLCEGDFVYLVGSDCFAFTEFWPEPFFQSRRPVMLINSEEDMRKHHVDALSWAVGTEKLLGFHPEHEYMRRLPLVYPRTLFAPFRSFVSSVGELPFDDCIYREWDRTGAVSESNLMGAYAHKHHPEEYAWVCQDGMTLEDRGRRFPNPFVCFWSHGGVHRPCDRDFPEYPGNSLGRTPASVFAEVRQKAGGLK